MRVGFGAVGLPVPVGAAMGGYAARSGGVTGELDRLWITAVTWYDGRQRAALAVADVICVNDDLTAAARALTSDVDLLWIAASHTHAGPETGCVPGGAATPPPWRERIAAGVRAAVDRAIADERVADGRAYSGMLRGVGAARSDISAEPVVPVDLLELVAGGRRLGVVVVLPVHPTVLPEENLLVSADLVGAVRRALASRLGHQVQVLVATGAAGDISTRHTRQANTPDELARLAGLVADHCLALLAEPGQPCWSPADALAWRTATVHLGPKPLSSGDHQELVASAAAAYANAREGGDPVAARIAEGRLHGARLAAAQPPVDGLDVEVGALRIGRLALAALPGEPFLALAGAIRDARPGPTVVLGYANGYPGYLPTAGAYPAQGYEVLASVVAPGSGERLAHAATDLLGALDEERDRGLPR